MNLEPGPGPEARKKLTGEIAGVDRIVAVFSSEIIIQNVTFGREVYVRKAQVHAVPFNRVGDAADKHDGPVRFLPFDNSHMGERIVDDAIAVVVPRVIEEDQISRLYSGPIMKRPVVADMAVNEPYTVRLRIMPFAIVQIDAVCEKNRPGHARAVVSNSPPVDLNGCGSYELGGSPNDIVSAWLVSG